MHSEKLHDLHFSPNGLVLRVITNSEIGGEFDTCGRQKYVHDTGGKPKREKIPEALGVEGRMIIIIIIIIIIINTS